MKMGDKMKRVNKKRKPRKELSIAVAIILILLFAIVFVLFGICIGFLINAFLNQSINDRIRYIFLTLLVGIIYMILLLILIRNSDSENVKPLKWYINCILISLTLTFIVTAITVFALQPGDGVINYLIGFGMFPLIGIITTPNIVKHVKKDTQKWKSIFYKNGNLENIKDSKDYYIVDTPVSFEKKILTAVYKHQILNILVVIGIMAFIIFLSVHRMTTDQSYTDNVVTNIMQTRANRSFGFILFLMIIFLAFGIPIIAYYISNALRKIRVVKRHEYIAYHAIVSGVHNSKITIYDGNKHYLYNYCTCVGIKEKNVHFTSATLIFIPDDVFLFPDNALITLILYSLLVILSSAIVVSVILFSPAINSYV